MRSVSLRVWISVFFFAAGLYGTGVVDAADDGVEHARQHRHEPYSATSHRRFDKVEQWVKVFDNPERDAWQKPEEVVAALRLAPGSSIADIGAGTGYFIERLSAAVGSRGTVYAVDTEPNLVAHMRERADQGSMANVVPVLASADNPRLPRASLDVALIVDTYHHIDDRLEYFRSVEHLLKPGGRVAVIDWREGDLPEGPGADHKLAPKQVISEMKAAGYDIAERHTMLPYQYFLVFRPSVAAGDPPTK